MKCLFALFASGMNQFLMQHLLKIAPKHRRSITLPEDQGITHRQRTLIPAIEQQIHVNNLHFLFFLVFFPRIEICDTSVLLTLLYIDQASAIIGGRDI